MAGVKNKIRVLELMAASLLKIFCVCVCVFIASLSMCVNKRVKEKKKTEINYKRGWCEVDNCC